MSSPTQDALRKSPTPSIELKLFGSRGETDTLPPPVVYAPKSGHRSKEKPVWFSSLTNPWRRTENCVGPVTSTPAPSTSINAPKNPGVTNHGEEIDEVVIDHIWTEDSIDVPFSKLGESADQSGGSHYLGSGLGNIVLREGFWAKYSLLAVLRWRMWPRILAYFRPNFSDKEAEAHYRKESWYLRKTMALCSAAFFIVNWVMGLAFLPGPVVLMDKIFYYGVAPIVTFPVLLMVMYDFPRDRPVLYQVFLWLTTWTWSIFQVLFISLCGKYNFEGEHGHFTCGSKDFLITFYYATALQTVALFGLRMNRFPATIGALAFFILSCALVVPQNMSWLRNIINFLVFQIILIYMHFVFETLERRVYALRDQLRTQYKATGNAQINERKASDFNSKLTSYFSQEVRVPLDNALMAVQNMEASAIVPEGQENELNALAGNLSVMSKALNDVLDINRMSSGQFRLALKPFAFHQVMRSMFTSIRLTADALNLGFVFDLDSRIDEVARRSAYEAMGQSPDSISTLMQEHSEVDGIVAGDETCLRRIITNLASNACKSTPAGGQLRISTQLILPVRRLESNAVEDDKKSPSLPGSPNENDLYSLSNGHLNKRSNHNAKPLENIVVRIEVTDTSHGIRSKDMIQNQLFTAFNQTEEEREQGGKETGLGLALVRQIVKLSGGRLGVRSKVGHGSTFWVELPFGVGSKTISSSDPPASVGMGGN